MKLRTKDGKLTAYAFACGYVESLGGFTLYREHGIYHVRGFGGSAVRHWLTVRTLSKARKTLKTLDNMYGLCGEQRKRNA